MPAEVNRRDFLRGAKAIVLAAALNRAYAGVSPEDLADDESFWNKIRSAYVRDPKILNLNNGGVAPTPTVVLDAEIDAIRYSNLLPSYRMWHDLEPGIEDVRKNLARIWNADPECIAITRNASESLQIAQFGLELQPGDEVLTTSQDYPRMITTWQQRERRDKMVLKQLDFAVPVRDPADLRALVRAGNHAAHPRHSRVASRVHDGPDISHQRDLRVGEGTGHHQYCGRSACFCSCALQVLRYRL